MPELFKMQCPKCGYSITTLPEAAKIGLVCPQCKAFVGTSEQKEMSAEELKRVTAALHELLRK